MTTITTANIVVTTKTSIARPIFEQMKVKGYARKDILNMFMKDAGMTEQGAATAFYNFTKMMKEGKIKLDGVAATATAPTKLVAPADTVLDDLTDIELTMFYSKYAPTLDTNLRTRDQVEEAIYDQVTFG